MIESNDCDVAVVGAGLAGLTAAYQLHARGQRVIVLEAKARVGGRLLAQVVPGGVVDAGATWIGPQQTAVLGLVEELALETWPQHHDGRHLLFWNGVRKSFKGDIPPLPWRSLLEVGVAVWRLDRMARTLVGIHAWEHRHAAAWDAISLGDWVERHTRTAGARFFFELVTGPSFGCKPAELSLLGFLVHVASAGGLKTLVGGKGAALDRHILGGAARLCEVIAARLGDRVRHDAPVSMIEQHGDAVRLTTPRGAVDAGRVVLAVDPATAASILHLPALPANRHALERAYKLGSGIKAHFVYPTPFWRVAGLSGQTFSNTGFVAMTFDVTPPGGAGVLMTFMGRAANHAPELLAPGAAAERRARALTDLVARFGPAAAAPIDYLEQDWTAERYQSGCVPMPAPGLITSARDALSQPVGRMHFAGAETARIWEGHMDGAVRSGNRAAEEIMQLEQAREYRSGPALPLLPD